MNRRAGLVLTTIAEPAVLEEYYDNFKAHDHLEQVKVYVIPDRKTPAGAFDRCAEFRKRSLQVVFPDFNEQECYLRKVGFPPELIPYNSDNRRNIGYLMALSDGNDFVISLDDDNYCAGEGDVFADYEMVCDGAAEHPVVESESGWFNICSLMEICPDVEAYARGFPYFARHKEPKVRETPRKVRVRVNAGLWLSEPDMDGISWLVNPVRTESFKGRSLVLGKRAWSPINTQNTSLHRDVLAAYYFIRMGYPLSGFAIDRYGDIFSGYFSQACVHHLGDRIRVGTPVAIHRRNSHNYMRDAANEMGCIWMLEDLLQWLPEQKLQGKSYGEAYISLSHLLEEASFHFQGPIWTDAARGFLSQMGFCMRKWAETCRKIG
jgi:hypothetical protein